MGFRPNPSNPNTSLMDQSQHVDKGIILLDSNLSGHYIAPVHFLCFLFDRGCYFIAVRPNIADFAFAGPNPIDSLSQVSDCRHLDGVNHNNLKTQMADEA